jgi:PEP-CTERM motif
MYTVLTSLLAMGTYVPEPSTWMVLGGMLGVGLYLRHRYAAKRKETNR